MAYKRGALSGLDDFVRVASNGLTLGGADWIANKFTGEDEVARTAASRENLGVFGDALTAATWLAPGGGILKAGRGAVNVARAAPTAARLVSSGAGVGNALRYATGIGRATAGQLVPIGAAVSKKGLAAKAAYLAAAAGIAGSMRGSGGDLPPVVADQVAADQVGNPPAAEQAVAQDPGSRLDDLRASALQAVLNDPKGVSLRALMAIGQAAPAPRKPFGVKDTAGALALNNASLVLGAGIKAAGDNIPEQQKAYLRYQSAVSTLAGVDPGKEELAAAMAAAREGQ